MGEQNSEKTRQKPSHDGKDRVFLVLVDDSEEMPVALEYACKRAAHTGGRVALLHVLEPIDFQHWIGVGELMKEEQRQDAEALMQTMSEKVMQWCGRIPVIYLREGNRAEALATLLREEDSISIVVLAASTKGEGAGPIISYLLNQGLGESSVPFTILPGHLRSEDISALT